jgi:hypothetical protein
MESHLDIVQASQSEPITVIVDQGEEQQDVKIPRALVGRTSHLLADMVKKSNGKPVSQPLKQCPNCR